VSGATAAVAAGGPIPATDGVTLRRATADHAPALHRLVQANVERARLLPRSLTELTAHAPQFQIAVDGAAVVGCGELVRLSSRMAEVRSLVVDERWRGQGVGTRLLSALVDEAHRRGFPMLCAFTHDPRPFVRLGFSIVPHVWVPEKIATDCHACVWFRRCTQYAVTLDLPTWRQDRPARLTSRSGEDAAARTERRS